MKLSSEVPDLSDAALDDHINDLQTQLDRITISLHLAAAEKQRRTEATVGHKTRQVTSEPQSKQSQEITSPPTLRIGSKVKILNKYKGNKGRIGTVIEISTKTATIYIPNRGNFIKHFHNLEILPDHNEA